MKNGWTGGQYSLFRVIAGAYLLIHFARQPFPMTLVAIAAVPFLIGFHDRIFALALIAAYRPLVSPIELLLVVHVLLPAAPYGSWDARGRVDPRGGWSFPPWLFLAARVAYLALAAWLLTHGVVPRTLIAGIVLLDPRWIPRALPQATDDVFYDGTCGLCHRAIRFLIAEDRSGTAFRFAPLGGDAFTALIGDAGGLPDSMVVRTSDGALLMRSDGALRIARRLGGIWRLLATIAVIVPRPLRNVAYDFIARIRYRLFARPKDACPMLPPDLRSRFSA